MADLNPYQLDTGSFQRTGKLGKKKYRLIYAISAAVLACLITLFFIIHFIGGGKAEKGDQPGKVDLVLSARDSELKQAASGFCLDFFNVSYSTIDVVKEKVKKRMTPKMQAAYEKWADDLDFTRKIKALGVTTPEFHIDSFEYPQISSSGEWQGRDSVIVHGEITYTLAVNRARGTFPIQALVIFERDSAKGLLIDNIILI